MFCSNLLISSILADEFCDSYPHKMIPTPGYWIECSRAISNQGSAWTNEESDLREIDDGITDSPDGSIKDAPYACSADAEPPESSVPRLVESALMKHVNYFRIL